MPAKEENDDVIEPDTISLRDEDAEHIREHGTVPRTLCFLHARLHMLPVRTLSPLDADATVKLMHKLTYVYVSIAHSLGRWSSRVFPGWKTRAAQ